MVLSTDAVAKGEVKECILRQPGPLSDNAHAPTNNHVSSFTGAAMGSEFDAVTEHVPDWNRHLRLAREMLDTQAHRLKPHTHPIHSPARRENLALPLFIKTTNSNPLAFV